MMGFLTLVIKSWMKNSVKHELEFEQFFYLSKALTCVAGSEARLRNGSPGTIPWRPHGTAGR